MKYKVGDKVRIKDIDWYNENKDNYDCVYAGNGFGFWKNMTRHCGETMKITTVKVDPEDSNKGFYFMENSEERWTDEMIEGLVEEEVGLVDSLSSRWVNEFELPDGYIFKDENGNVINATKIVLEKKKKEYSKTFLGCCDVLGIEDTISRGVKGYRSELLDAFQKLLICRDAYWKIAGEEMGLDKPWELSIGTPIYYIYYNRTVGTIKNDYADDIQGNIILAFPTAEMRDAFYENFKELILSCKELL